MLEYSADHDGLSTQLIGISAQVVLELPVIFRVAHRPDRSRIDFFQKSASKRPRVDHFDGDFRFNGDSRFNIAERSAEEQQRVGRGLEGRIREKLAGLAQLNEEARRAGKGRRRG